MQKINRRATTQDLILKVLRRRKKPLTAKQISEKIGKPHDATRHALNRMLKHDTAYRVLEGRQTLWVL